MKPRDQHESVKMVLRAVDATILAPEGSKEQMEAMSCILEYVQEAGCHDPHFALEALAEVATYSDLMDAQALCPREDIERQLSQKAELILDCVRKQQGHDKAAEITTDVLGTFQIPHSALAGQLMQGWEKDVRRLWKERKKEAVHYVVNRAANCAHLPHQEQARKMKGELARASLQLRRYDFVPRPAGAA